MGKLFAAFEIEEGIRALNIPIGKKQIRVFSIAWWIAVIAVLVAGYAWCLGMCVLLV